MTLPEMSPIAVVGVAYRVPGIGRKGLYEFLSEGKSAFSRVPKDRFEQEAYHFKNSEKGGVFSPDGAHFLPDDIYAFDAAFYNMTAEEVKSMDPQHRIMLECAFEAAENAGIPLSELYGSNTGVFAAMDRCGYGEQLLNDLPTTTKYSAFSVAGCMAANRVSYFMGLRGPSISLDSACSSSTYAVHLACQSLRMMECNAAFAGAASLMVNPHLMVALDTMGALSPDGKCYAYDSRRNGFGIGEGGACLILKRLEDALTAGDTIQAVIRHTSCNHSGHTRGITMPSQLAQEDLLRRVHAEVGLKASDTGFVEGHGTGTDAGDPIEGAAVANVMARERAGPVYIGSVKSNFGHLLNASGMVSVVKGILMLQHATILPNSGFKEMSPALDALKLKVTQMPIPWPSETARRVCVTNFGFGGSNAAVLLEEFKYDALRSNASVVSGTANGLDGALSDEQEDARGHSLPPCRTKNGVHINESSHNSSQRLFVFSAKSAMSLVSFWSSLTSYLKELSLSVTTDTFLADLSFTLGQRRTHFSHRFGLVADSVEGLIQQLSSLNESSIGKARPAQELVSVFIFTGQGAQHAAMAAGLYEYEPFAAALLSAERYLQEFGATWSLAEELCKPEGEGSRIGDAEISQPACTAVQLGLVALLHSWGISPTVVGGHSSGEIAAAYAAGFVSFRTAMALAFFRGKAAVELREKSQATLGGMVALGTDVDTATKLLESTAQIGRAGIAAINSPNSVTISGDMAAIYSISQIAEVQGIFNRMLKVDVAYHSHHMELVAASYQAAIEPFCDAEQARTGVEIKPTFFSSVTGLEECADTVKGPSYWVRNLVNPVRFSQAIESILSHAGSDGRATFAVIELGPHPALKGPIKQTLQSMDETRATYLPTLLRGTDGTKALLGLAGHMFTLGSSLNFAAVNRTLPKNANVLTDLPSYQWKKDTRYLRKSPRSAQELHPGHTYNPLLGWKMPSEGNEHIFRQVFSLDEMPWIRDHDVAGDAIFPFVGFVRLAVEALKAISQEVSSALIRELHVKRSLMVNKDQAVDMTTKLRKAEMGTGTFSSTIWTFEVMTWTESASWTLHAHGRIESDTMDFTKAGSPAQTMAEKVIPIAEPTAEDAVSEYQRIQESGISLGPTFRNMTTLWTAPGVAVHETVSPQIDQESFQGSQAAVDVVTLDSVLHSARCTIFGDEKHSVFVPVSSSRFQLSTVPATAGQKFTTVGRRLHLEKKSGLAHAHFVVFASTGSGRVPYLELDMTFQRLTQSDTTVGNSRQELPEGFYESLVPHFGFVEGNTLADMLADKGSDATQLLMCRKLSAVSRHFLAHALKTTADDNRSTMPSHFTKFLRWAEGLVQEVDDLEVTPELIDEISKSSAVGELLRAVGEQIQEILRGTVQPLEIMMKDGILTRYYEENMVMRRSSEALSRYVAGLGEINPKLRILEVGAGTGAATLPILEALSEENNDSPPNFSSYVFTDISSGFFENARQKLSRWPQLIYQKLDITRDPAEQGIEVGTYDVVVAVNVLHATPDIKTTIQNVRTLLKPGTGKLGIVEHADNNDPAVLPFALLPGWWLASDEYRTLGSGPLMPRDRWHQLLTCTGFSGVEGAIECGGGGTFWTRRVEEGHNDSGLTRCLSNMLDSVTICGPLATPEDRKLAEAVGQAVSQILHIPTPRIQSLAELHDPGDRFCVFIDSAKRSFLTSIASEDEFNKLKSVLLKSRGLLWVTPENDCPEYARIKGILRTLRLEDTARKLLHVADIPLDTPQGAASAIAQLTLTLVGDMTPTAFREQDFVWRNEILHVPRLRRLQETTETFALEAGASICKKRGIWADHGPENALRLSIHATGNLDSIYFEQHNLIRTGLDDDEILVKVDAVGINFRDVLTCLGTIPWSAPGCEGAGTVVQVGAKVSHVQAGDRVLYVMSGGGFSTYVRIRSLFARRVPQGIPAEVAASLPAAYMTALVCLDNVAQMKRGESVLVHAASGAVGQACINVAQSKGAVVFATAGSVEKRDFLHRTFAIPESRICSSRTPEFRQQLMKETDGKGVDVVVNCLSGQLLQETWSLIAEFGRFIEIGKKDMLENSHLSMRNFLPNVTFATVSLDRYFPERPEVLQECLVKIVDMMEKKIIKPIHPVTKVPVSEVQAGFRKLQSGQNIGKIVAIMGRNERVMVECWSPLQQQDELLQANATYLITGGTGGIGRAVVPMLLDNGAANIILLGRSGNSHPEVAKLIEEYDRPKSGTHVRAISCNIASRASLCAALDTIKDLPPVRGVIHGSLFLRDSIFMNATFEDWRNINGPKIDGAWHIHELLPTLDFFVALASAIGVIGNIGQSIYAGTSTFLDALAKYRSRQGSPSVSINLPIIDDVGYVVQRDGLRCEMVKQNVGIKLSISQVLAAVKGAIIGASSGLNKDSRAIVYVREDCEETEGWEDRSHYLTAARRRNAPERAGYTQHRTICGDEDVLETLCSKVSAITMIDREDVTPSRKLSEYGLDSLVAVELRHWIRREFGVDLALAHIVGAEYLQALADQILSGLGRLQNT